MHFTQSFKTRERLGSSLKTRRQAERQPRTKLNPVIHGMSSRICFRLNRIAAPDLPPARDNLFFRLEHVTTITTLSPVFILTAQSRCRLLLKLRLQRQLQLQRQILVRANGYRKLASHAV